MESVQITPRLSASPATTAVSVTGALPASILAKALLTWTEIPVSFENAFPQAAQYVRIKTQRNAVSKRCMMLF
jgi:hypothetical protein